ncbi:MAG TPA: TetR/AcrR family transcriptional regulator [Ktedonobacteraceae bacterium]
MPHSPDPVQAQFIAARRNQILDAAAKVFAEKGFHPATIKDIATEAGIAHGSIYTYFENKTALLLGIFERMKASIMQENPPLALDAIDVRTFIQMIQLPLMGLKKDNFALFRIVVSEMMVNEELRTLYYKQIMEPTLTLAEAAFQELAAQRGLSQLKMQLTIRAISGMILGLILEYAMGDSILTEQWEDLPDFLADLILKGLDGI